MFALLALAPVTSALADVSVNGDSDSNSANLGLTTTEGTSIGDASGNNCNNN